MELQSASNFLVHLVKLGRRDIDESKLETFRQALAAVLRRRYRDHWLPESPLKGSGYRCIHINGKMNPIITQAAESCALSPQLIHSSFPSEFALWIDPLQVSFRIIGENGGGATCVLYESERNAGQPWTAAEGGVQTAHREAKLERENNKKRRKFVVKIRRFKHLCTS